MAGPTLPQLAPLTAFLLENFKCKTCGEDLESPWSFAWCAPCDPCPEAAVAPAGGWCLWDLAYLGSAGFSWTVAPHALGLMDA